ncbi:type II secretion system protein GspD (plasmid) [Enterobacteriaceae bacterium Kacie_13]|nr:type II secretion system protein GspD [Enterobacteriaceae bacterium Kacie_13]
MNKLRAALIALNLGLCSLPLMAQGINADFNNVEMSVFVDAVSRATHTEIVHSVPLKGKISLQSKDLTQEEYLNLFRVLLRANGYRVEQVGDLLKIVEAGGATDIYPAQENNESAGSLVTRTQQLNTLPVGEVIAQLNALSGGKTQASLSGLNSGNVLMLSGYADEVSRLQGLATRLDKELGHNNDVVKLQNASATEIARVIGTLIASGDFGRGSLKASVVADNRTNSLILNGSDDDRRRLHALVAQLDRAPDVNSDDGVVYLKYTTSDAIEKAIGKLVKSKDPRYGDVSVVSVPDINAVVVSASKEKQSDVISLIHQLDIRRAQVHVEAMIVEVSDGDGINFGVQWGDNKGSLMQFTNGSQLPLGVLQAARQQASAQAGSTVIGENGSTTVNPDTQGDLSTLMALMSGYNGAALSIVKGNWMALVQAMKGSSHANILSTPSLTTLDNQSASFMVGQNVPILTGSTASADNKTPFQTVDRRDVGTRLTILPQINEGEAVQLKINAEVSKVEGNTGLDVVFAERKLETSVLVNDGAMIVLGGLIDQQKDESEYKVPVLGDIPVIGNLFSSRAKKTQKRNLMIFIRPTIIRDGLTADGITQKKYNYIRAQQLLEDAGDADIGAANRRGEPEINAFRQAAGKKK